MAEDFVEVEEGTLVDGGHFHLYKGLKTGLYQIGIERDAREAESS